MLLEIGGFIYGKSGVNLGLNWLPSLFVMANVKYGSADWLESTVHDSHSAS